MSHRLGPFATEWAWCSCSARFQRPAGETCTTCLSCQTTQRLTDAGISPDDPALAIIAAFSAEAQRKSGTSTKEVA
jgi:hypothetical protein